MKLQWRGKDLKDMLWMAASATTMQDFKEYMGYLKDINEDAYDWICQIPPQHWARSHFTGRAHTDILLNNLCEVFNSKIKDGRDKPIITALEYFRTYVMRKMTNVQGVIDKCNGPLTPFATTIMEKAKQDANNYKVLWNGRDKYEVSGPWMDQCVVSLNEKSCTCRRWEVTGIPCKHAIAAIWYSKQGGTPEMWVLPVYWLDTWRAMYEKKIEPINGRKMWPKSACPTKLLAPKHNVQVGRPKKNRVKARDEAMEQASKQRNKLSRKFLTVTCSKCKNKGHNSRTCKGQGGDATASTGSNVAGKRKRSQTSTPQGGGRGSNVAAGRGANVATGRGANVHGRRGGGGGRGRGAGAGVGVGVVGGASSVGCGGRGRGRGRGACAGAVGGAGVAAGGGPGGGGGAGSEGAGSTAGCSGC